MMLLIFLILIIVVVVFMLFYCLFLDVDECVINNGGCEYFCVNIY